MYIADSTSRQPVQVGVAPGTTTLLTGPTAPVVGCENPARVARQQYIMYPPGKFVQGAPPQFTQAGRAAQANAAQLRPVKGNGTTPVRNAITRMAAVLDPYGTIESLKGTLRGVMANREERLGWVEAEQRLGYISSKREHPLGYVAANQEVRMAGLGYVTAPYGDRKPYPSSEIVAVTKSTGRSNAYCTDRPERRPNYRWWQTSRYTPEGKLGAVPTDLQLATQYGYTPVVSQWAPFNQGAYSPLSWTPPYGAPDLQPQNQGYMTQLAGPRTTLTRLGDMTDDVVQPAADVAQAAEVYDAGRAAVEELKRHQDRMFSLGIFSAAAVASTALVNVFRYAAERRDVRKRSGRNVSVAAEPTPTFAGARGQQRRSRR